MNTRNQNRSFGLFIVSLFTVMVIFSTLASASNIEVGKFVTEPGEFVLGDVINFTVYVKNPNSVASGIINTQDVVDTLPDGSVQLMALNLVLQPQEFRKYYVEYTVKQIDDDRGFVINMVHVEGIDSRNDIISAATSTRAMIVVPSIDIEKTTNGEDADTPTGPVILVGTQVAWEYVVTNDGAVPLENIWVTDNQGVVVTCPLSSLGVGESMTCTATGTAEVGQYSNIGTATGEHNGIQVSDNDPSHYFGEAMPSIDIEKSTNGEDADTPTGPVLLVGDTVDWAYVVTNDGNVPLENVGVTDDQGVVVTCSENTLDVGESMTCSASGTAVVGQYSNIGTATGEHNGVQVNDDDPSHYIVEADLSIDIEKATNGEDADTPTGPELSVGDTVDWTYVVTNDGNVPLVNVEVTDDQGVSVTCLETTLDVGESMTCTASGTAEVGQYSNIGTATGEHNGVQVSDDDPSHYIVEANPSVDIEKATNDEDADTPTGPQLPVGDSLTWTYVVTNEGNVPLENVVVTDNKSVTVTCPETTLDVGESMTCTATGTAEVGQYSNMGTVTADYDGIQVMDEDPSHYFGFCTGIIGDYVWLDKNGDGIQDSEELGIANVDVELYLNSVLLGTDTTNSEGIYIFTELCAGDYVVGVVDSTLPDGVVLTTPPEPMDVNLGVGEENRDIDFGYKCSGTIGDFVWEDIDGDGIQDLGEIGIEDVEVSLYLDNGNSIIDPEDNLLGTITTDANGNYLFEDLCSGRYIVEINDSTVPAEYVLTTPPEPRAVDLETGEEKLDVDFGYLPPCPCYGAIGDLVWMDTDNDKIPDADESGIQGVMVKLYQDANGNEVIDPGDNLYVIKVTGANGNFIFTGLCEGKYIIEIDETSLPQDVVLTTPPEPKVIDLMAGQHLLGNDFGYSEVLVTSS